MCELCIESSLSTWERHDATAAGELSISTNNTVWDTSQVINQLDSGYSWSGSSLTYSFATNANWFPYSEKNKFSSFNATQKATAKAGIELWDDLIQPGFTKINDAGASDIKFSNTTSNIGYAHAYYPGSWTGAGSIWLNDDYLSLSDPDLGEYGFMTVLHELGHALGLDHAGDYNGGSPSYNNDASHAQDSTMYTIMSYFGGENTGADWGFSDGRYAYAQTPMVHDVLAIQAIYGADNSTRKGNTVYGFNSNAGNDIFDFDSNKHPVLTIWDGGGKDTLNLSGYSDDSIVNLEPGSFSDAFGAVNNLAIAFGTWIEDAIGGTGNDLLTGNRVANTLRGHAGNDTLYGLKGSDSLFGNSGKDNLIGNGGADTLKGGSGNDKLRGSSGDDALYGNGGADTLIGGSGNDKLRGSNGNDALRGNGGADKLRGGKGDDQLKGGPGNDRLIGGEGNDTLTGGGDADTFVFRKAIWGRDVITDFENGSDIIDMRNSGTSAGDLNVSNSGGDAVVDFGGSDKITLIGEAGSIDASDFIF